MILRTMDRVLLTYRWPITYDRAKITNKAKALGSPGLLQCVALLLMIRCPDKAEPKQLIHFHGAQPMPQLSCPRIYHSWLAVLQFMDHWAAFLHFSTHWGSHANCISGLPVQPKDPHVVVTHCIVLAIFITLNSSAQRQARLWEPTPGDFPVLLEAILWLFLLTIQTPIEPHLWFGRKWEERWKTPVGAGILSVSI